MVLDRSGSMAEDGGDGRTRLQVLFDAAPAFVDVAPQGTRLGLVLPRGARDVLPQLAPVCKQELKWSDERWREEEQRYLQLWERDHAPVPAG